MRFLLVISLLRPSHQHAKFSLVLSGWPGTDHHIPFPISIRASFGYYFANFCVISRALLGAVWFGVNTYYGSFIVTEVSLCSMGSLKPLVD